MLMFIIMLVYDRLCSTQIWLHKLFESDDIIKINQDINQYFLGRLENVVTL